MKKAFLAVLLTFAAQVGWTDTKISAFPSTTTLNSTDIIPVVTTPGGTPANKVITKTNLFSNMGPITASTFTITGSSVSFGPMGVTVRPGLFENGINFLDGNYRFYPVFYRTNIVTGSPTGDTAGRQPLAIRAPDGIAFGRGSYCGGIGGSTSTVAANWPAGGCPYLQFQSPDAPTADEAFSWTKYGSFGVEGSSANLQATFSGFTSTNNVDQSTLWVLPRKDGTNGQALITNGSKQLSFGSVATGSGSSLTVSSLTVSDASSAIIALYDNAGAGTSTGKIISYENLVGIQQRGSIVFNDPNTGSIRFYQDSTNPTLTLNATGNSATFTIPVAVSTFTTAIANFTGPALSTVTYGISVGSMNVTGTGDGSITLTILAATYTVTATSSTNTAFHMAGFSGNNQLIDIGLPIAPGGFGTINAGTLGRLGYYTIAGSTISDVPGTLVTATSVTLPQTAITSTMTVLVGAGSMLNSPAAFSVYVNGDTIGQTLLFNIGSQQHIDQLYMVDKTYLYSEYGLKTNSLQIGNATGGNTKIGSTQSANQSIDIYNSGQMEFQTSTFATPDMIFRPSIQQVLRLSTTSVAINGTSDSRYTLRITSGTTGILPYQIAFTTMGVITVSSQTASAPALTSCGTNPISIGNSHAFQITGGAASTGCIATFPAGAYRNAPSCSVSQETMSVINALTYSATNTALTISQTGLGTGKLDIICYGLNE